MDAIKEEGTISELSSQFAVHGSMVNKWKAYLLKWASHLFEKPKSGSSDNRRPLSTMPCSERSANWKLSWTFLKKIWTMSAMERGVLIEASHPDLSVLRQCELLEVNRSSWYYKPVPVSQEELAIMKRLDELYTAHPFLGSRNLRHLLGLEGYQAEYKRVYRLIKRMGLETIYPKPKTSI